MSAPVSYALMLMAAYRGIVQGEGPGVQNPSSPPKKKERISISLYSAFHFVRIELVIKL